MIRGSYEKDYRAMWDELKHRLDAAEDSNDQHASRKSYDREQHAYYSARAEMIADVLLIMNEIEQTTEAP